MTSGKHDKVKLPRFLHRNGKKGMKKAWRNRETEVKKTFTKIGRKFLGRDKPAGKIRLESGRPFHKQKRCGRRPNTQEIKMKMEGDKKLRTAGTDYSSKFLTHTPKKRKIWHLERSYRDPGQEFRKSSGEPLGGRENAEHFCGQ